MGWRACAVTGGFLQCVLSLLLSARRFASLSLHLDRRASDQRDSVLKRVVLKEGHNTGDFISSQYNMPHTCERGGQANIIHKRKRQNITHIRSISIAHMCIFKHARGRDKNPLGGDGKNRGERQEWE